MQFTSSFLVKNADVIINATSSLEIQGPVYGNVVISAKGAIEATPAGETIGYAELPALVSIGGDISEGYGVGYAELQGLTSSGQEEDYIPTQAQEGYADLSPLTSFGVVKTTSIATGYADLQSLVSMGGEGNYGSGFSELRPFESQGWEGPGLYVANCISYALANGDSEAIFDTIVYLNSYGQITETVSGTRVLIQEIIDSIETSSSASTLGTFIVSLDSSAAGLFSYGASINDRPDLNDSARVWVVNIDTNASSQYENYGFSEFTTDDDGTHYGFANDGIYKLEGDNDDGEDIATLLNFGKTNLDSPYKKRVPNIYLGVSSDEKVYLKVEADGAEYTYEAKSYSSELKNHRVDTGKGLKGNYLNFTLVTEGTDFEVESITFTPINLSRKI